MIDVRHFNSLGKADFGWLKANFHFNFGDYVNGPNNFGPLRVINDDIIAAHTGFDMHPHRDMEIITYVRTGALSHEDDMGNKGATKAGDVQVMSAGTGIYHSEYNHSDDDINSYQIWIMPNKQNVKPRWEQAEFPQKAVTNRLPLLVSGRDEDTDSSALFIHQDAAIYGGRLNQGTSIDHPIKYQAYVLISCGEVEIDGTHLNKGDAAAITEQNTMHIKAKSNAEVVVIDVPATF